VANILIVEDSATQAEMLAAMLEEDGHRVTKAVDAEKALAACAADGFDAVISDIVMPGMSGYELCRRLKGGEASAHMPVMLLSTLNEPMDIIRGLECGADNFLTKPCSSELLCARLRSLLTSREIRTSHRAALGVEICFLGQRFTINSEKEQILDLLISTFEDTVRANRELQHNRAELAEANGKLEEYATTLEDKVRLRTSELLAANKELEAEIAAHRATAGELKNTSAFLDRIIENIPTGVIIKDARSLQFVLVNAEAEESIGMPSERLIGMTAHDLLPKEIAERVTSRDRKALQSGRVTVSPEEVIHREGRPERHVRTRLAPIYGEDGQPRYLAILTENVSEMRKLEHQVRHTQKMDTIGHLTGGIAHDFNNLLGIILGNLDLLTERIVGDADSAEIAQEALQAARRGAELTQRMLAFARKQPLQPRAFDLNDTVKSMASMLRRTLGANIDLSVAPAADLWPVIADPSQIEDVILNLAVNARDAMPNGGHLLIETSLISLDSDYAEQNPDVSPGDYVLLAVSDSGTGMSPEILERVCEPFFTTKDVGRGTGLGLSMVYGFAKQSGGHLKIYSEVGQGTTIRLYLPGTLDVQEAHPDKDEDMTSLAASGERILLVEDNAGLRRTTLRILNDLGYRVVEAEDGVAALDILTSDIKMDLLLTDIVMPRGVSGYDLAATCEQLRPDVKILFMSGYSENFLNNINVAKRPINLISKPCRKQELARKLRAMLERVA
jgi:PAS domain S-box-containing protein